MPSDAAIKVLPRGSTAHNGRVSLALVRHGTIVRLRHAGRFRRGDVRTSVKGILRDSTT